jgi:hypothetical protein
MDRSYIESAVGQPISQATNSPHQDTAKQAGKQLVPDIAGITLAA